MSSSDLLIRAHLRQVRPRIVRFLRIPGRLHLGQLHLVLQAAFGWRNCHLHEFRIGGRRFQPFEAIEYDSRSEFEIEEEEAVRLNDIPAHLNRFLYVYDFGDHWEVGLRVLERSAARPGQRPEILEGARAAPPEDCGGLFGYGELLRDVELRSMYRGWQPEVFDQEKASRALARRFPPPKAKPEPRPLPEAPPPLAATGFPPLEGYRLEKLTVFDQMVAALLASSEPLDLGQLVHWLEQSGTRLNHGAESLKKAWKRRPPIRERLDGRLEVDFDSPGWWRNEMHLRESRLDWVPPAPPPPPEAPPSDHPVTREELSRVTRLPSTLSVRRTLLLYLEALGGEAWPVELAEAMAADQRIPPGASLHTSLSSEALEWAGDRVRLIAQHPHLVGAREVLRKWAQRYHPRPTLTVDYRAREARERAEVHARFQSLRRAVVRWFQPGLATFFDVASGQVRVLRGQSRVAEALEDLDCVVGLNPKGLAELLDISYRGKRFIDLNWLDEGFRPSRVSVGELVQCTVGLTLIQDDGFEGRSPADFEADVRALALFYRYGIQHGQVRSWREEFRAPWNVGGQARLTEALGWSAGVGKPISLWRRGQGNLGAFQVSGVERSAVSGSVVLGEFVERPGRVQLMQDELMVDWQDDIDLLAPFAVPTLLDYY